MILVIDNYDSFTYNLYNYLAQIHSNVLIKRNDAITIEEIIKLSPQAIVISPGPKRPKDAGITMSLIDQFHAHTPILGICLGYQAIGEYFGSELIASPQPTHGKTSLIYHQNDQIFNGIKSPTSVMRYHSLNIHKTPSDITIIAETLSEEPMALKHKILPLYGLQFHPESFLSIDGMQMLINWYNFTIKPII